MAKYAAHHPPLIDKPGTNWVERAGGLPKPIDAIARALVAKGMPESRAIATAVNSVRKTCSTGMAFGGKTKVSAEAQAVACKAAAGWEALKARSKSMANEGDDRRKVELAFKRIEGDALELARGHQGLVQAKIQVRSRRGKTYTRTVWVRPRQAKALKAKGAKLSEQGVKVTGAAAKVLGELAKIPKNKRPNGWQDVVKALVDPKHHGRLGPAARKALHAMGRNAEKGSPLHKAAYGALASDVPKKKLARAVRRRRRKRAARAKAVVMANVDRVTVELAPKTITAEERRKAPTAYNGSFPIRNRDELKRAIQAIGRAPADKRAKVKAFCIRRAKALGAMDLIPSAWLEKQAA